MDIHKKYLERLSELRRDVESDFIYYSKQNSVIDRRLNELGARKNIEATAEEMMELLAQRSNVKDTVLKLLPLYDFFKSGYSEMEERIKKAEDYDKTNKIFQK